MKNARICFTMASCHMGKLTTHDCHGSCSAVDIGGLKRALTKTRFCADPQHPCLAADTSMPIEVQTLAAMTYLAQALAVSQVIHLLE
ncbi:hypothetical protein [Hoeflea sp. IMCC20628]|uniref:hypothetical protein n=1 Tax=Hoeflea sp. IMCC20628 TaxID=1620421 RepID=UPI0012E0B5FF|nr:hypothetical protein [Hoeflea sp. IMCC20628]